MMGILRRGRARSALALVSTLALTGIAGTAQAAPAGVPHLLDLAPATVASAPAGLLDTVGLAVEADPALGPASLDDASPAALAAAAAPPLRKASWGGRRSGLPWASGASSGAAAIASWRGRPLDIRTGFLEIRNGWEGLTQVSWVRALVEAGGIPVLGVGLLPTEARGQLAECASGAFDAHIRRIGVGLVAAGAGNAVLRLGWEANRIGSFPWAITREDGPGPFKACFRRWVQVLRSVPGELFTFDWNNGARGTLPYHVDLAYPGDDYVDVIGVQYYDRCPPAITQADWDRRHLSKNDDNGSPYGIGAWLSYAKSKGKRLSVPEWGIGGQPEVCDRPGIDNPLFMRNMFRFFEENADSIAYEAYFNGARPTGSHVIAPPNDNPMSWAAYDALWGRR